MTKPTTAPADYFGMSRRVWIGTAVAILLLPLIFIEDGPIRAVLKDLRVPVLFKLMHILTWIGKGWVLMAAAAILLGIGYRRTDPELKQAGALGLMALTIAGLAVQTIKHLVGRPRPDLADQGIMNWGPSLKSGYDSFPSGHAISAFAMAAVMTAVYPSGRWVWYSLAVLVAFTRVYINAHFPSDVLAGAVLGLLIGLWVSKWKPGFLKS